MGIVAFTGHRPEKLNFKQNEKDPHYVKFREILYKAINRLVERGNYTFISGMARGFDMWAAEDVCGLKLQNEHVKLVCAIPFENQSISWAAEDRDKWEELTEKADKRVVISQRYTKSCFHERNRYMVDNSDIVVCCFDGTSGGTAYTVDYAIKKNKTVICIDPNTVKVSFLNKNENF